MIVYQHWVGLNRNPSDESFNAIKEFENSVLL